MPGCSLGLGMETRCSRADARAPATSPLHQQRAGVMKQEGEFAGETPAADPSPRATTSLGKREEIQGLGLWEIPPATSPALHIPEFLQFLSIILSGLKTQ